MRAGTLGLDIKIHQRVEKMLVSKWRPVQHVSEHALCHVRAVRPDTVEKDRHQSRLDIRALDVVCVSQERDAYRHYLLTLCRRDDVRHVGHNVLEVGDNILEKVLRKASEDIRRLGRQW